MFLEAAPLKTFAPKPEPEGKPKLPLVTEDETKTLKKAPGPDGIPDRVLPVTVKHLEENYRALLNAWLKSRDFPKDWKTAFSAKKEHQLILHPHTR